MAEVRVLRRLTAILAADVAGYGYGVSDERLEEVDALLDAAIAVNEGKRPRVG